MEDENKPVSPSEVTNSEKSAYSEAIVDTMFADSLPRGMQNAITSQQNAQMASSAPITNACARILQAESDSKVTPDEKK